jgi:crotonobetainyl-CoA:carnitine CoA-transferase CaiB-like acyl-CoA transferase
MADFAGPLADVRIVDLTRILAGPYATMRLADLGAEVVKVENPDGGDDTRAWGPPFVAGVATYFFAVNRGKRSIAVDLKRPDGKAVLARLLARADVLIENFRPGTLDRLGFSWPALADRFPRLIYCAISGYGHEGSFRDKASYDVIVQAEAGVMDLTGEADGPPLKAGFSLADTGAAANAVVGILAALYARERTGRGDRIDVALYDGVLSQLTYQAQMWLSCGRAPRRLGNAHPSLAPYEPCATADGALVIGAGNDALFAKLCAALGLGPDVRADPRFATNRDRVANRAALKALLEARLAARPAREWAPLLDAAGIPCGLVRTVPEALDQARRDTRGILVSVDHPQAGTQPMVGEPVRLDSARPASTRAALPPPGLGEHTDPILREAGFAEEEIAALRTSGAVA